VEAKFARSPDVRATRSLYKFMPYRWTIFPTWPDVSVAALGDSLDLGHRESTDYFGDPRMHA